MQISAKALVLENDTIIAEVSLYNNETRTVFIIPQSFFGEIQNVMKIEGPMKIWCDTDIEYQASDASEPDEFSKLEPKENLTTVFFVSGGYCDFNNAVEGEYTFYFNRYIEICETPDVNNCEMTYFLAGSVFHLDGPILSAGVTP